jgi:hypothetical protein
LILVEISMLKTIFKSIQFLMSDNHSSTVLGSLAGSDGVIEHCHGLMKKLEKLFPSDSSHRTSGSHSKKQKTKMGLAALAWPFREARARKLMDEIIKCKTTINLALTAQSM